MAKFIELECGAIVNVYQIVAIKYDDINKCNVIYTTAIDSGCLSGNVVNLRFKATQDDIKNILEAKNG